MPPQAPEPEFVADRFPEERAALLEVLRGLAREQWDLPTVCDGWSVKDIAAHLVGDDLQALASGRDGERSGWIDGGFDEVLAELNRRNEAWVDAWRPVSPRVIVETLEDTGARIAHHFASVDQLGPGPNVAWAGPGEHPMWLHVARDLTERWLHQAQIRDALGVPAYTDPRVFGAVLRTFARALPVSFATREPEPGASVEVEITGEAGSTWTVRREHSEWTLLSGVEAGSTARVTLDQDIAWRLWTKGMTPDEARSLVTIEGDAGLGEPVLEAVAIIA